MANREQAARAPPRMTFCDEPTRLHSSSSRSSNNFALCRRKAMDSVAKTETSRTSLIPASSSACPDGPRRSIDRMSYLAQSQAKRPVDSPIERQHKTDQACISMPLFSVTGRTGAFGSTTRVFCTRTRADVQQCEANGERTGGAYSSNRSRNPSELSPSPVAQNAKLELFAVAATHRAAR